MEGVMNLIRDYKNVKPIFRSEITSLGLHMYCIMHFGAD